MESLYNNQQDVKPVAIMQMDYRLLSGTEAGKKGYKNHISVVQSQSKDFHNKHQNKNNIKQRFKK